MFRITEGKGFQIVFSNGVVVSVQFGPGNYCANRSIAEHLVGDSCPNVEVAIWKNEQDGYLTSKCFGGQDVEGWCSPEQVLQALNWAAAQPKKD